MSDNNDVVEIKEKVYSAEDFAQEYEALCKRSGFQISVNPAYVKRDDGSYSTVLQISVGEKPKE